MPCSIQCYIELYHKVSVLCIRVPLEVLRLQFGHDHTACMHRLHPDFVT